MATKNTEVTRHYGLSKEEITELKAEFKSTKKLPNPHRGNYGAIVAALISLGADKFYAFETFEAKVQKEMGAAWKVFANKKARNENGKADASDRLLQNAKVLGRTKDYGKKILDLGKVIGTKGVVIDLQRKGEGFEIRLNTDSNTPMAPGRAPKSQPTQKASKSSAKPQKATVKASKAAKTVKAPILEGREAIAALRGMKKAKAKK